MKKHYLRHFAKSLLVFVLTSSLYISTALADHQYIEQSCDRRQDDLSAVESFIRGRTTPVDGEEKSLGQLEELRAKALAKKAIIEGIELLRERYAISMALVNNDETCDYYLVLSRDEAAAREKYELCKSGNASGTGNAPKKSYFSIINERSLATLEKAKQDAVNIYGMESTIKNLLTGDESLESLMKDAPPATGNAPIIAALTQDCTAALAAPVDPADAPDAPVNGKRHFCEILKTPDTSGANFEKKTQLENILNKFSRAFHLGYKARSASGTPSTEDVDAAKVALREYQTQLMASPINGDRALLSNIGAMNDFGDKAEQVYLTKMDCKNRIARGNTGSLDLDHGLNGSGSGSGTRNGAIVSFRRSGSGTGRGNSTIAFERAQSIVAAHNTEDDVCNVSIANLETRARASERSMRTTARTGLGLANATGADKFSLTTGSVLAEAGTTSLFALADQTEQDHAGHLSNWLKEVKAQRDNVNSANFYMFDRSTVNAVLNRKVNDVTTSTPASPEKISQGANLKKFLLNASNRSLMESKLNKVGAERNIVAGEFLNPSDLDNDFKVARHFLKSMNTYQADLFNGELAAKCPGPDYTTLMAVNPNSPNADQKKKMLEALDGCMKLINTPAGQAMLDKKTALTADVAKYDTAIGVLNNATSRPDVDKAKKLRTYLTELMLLKCRTSSPVQCQTGVTRDLNDTTGLNPVRFLTSATGKALSRLSPGDISSPENEETIHEGISALCREEIPQLNPPAAPVPAPAVADGASPPPPVVAAAPAAPATLASRLGSICAVHNPIIGGPIVGNAHEVTPAQEALTRSRLNFLENNHTTFLPNGEIASATPKESVGGQVLIGAATGFASVIAPTLIMIPGIQAETAGLVQQAQFQITMDALTKQNADYLAANGGFFGFGPSAPFGGAGFSSGFGFGGGGGFSSAGFDSGYSAYLGAQ